MDGETPATRRDTAAARSSCSTAPAAGTLAGIRRLAYDGTELPVDRRRARARRDHDARHRPGRRAALPAEGDQRGAASFRKTLRGKIVERDGVLHAVRRRRARSRRRSRPGWPPAPSRGSVSSGRARPPSPARAWPSSLDGCWPTASLDVDAITATELSGFQHAPRHERHAGRRRQPERHHHRHQPHRRPRPRPRRRRARHRQPPQQRPHRQGRRRAVHVRRPRRRDERGLDQGVLRAGRRRRAAGVRDRRSRRARRRRAPARAARRPCARCPTRCSTCSPAGRDDRRGGAPVRPAERYWAVVGNGPNRVAAEEVRIKLSELCYKSIACDVTEDKKHIDLSSRAADPRVRRRAARVAPPTTSPRRWRSTGPTRRRRS